MGDALSPLMLVALAFLGFSLSSEISSLRKRLSTLARIEAKLDLVLEHAGLKYVPYANLPATVIEALHNGEKIQAIKHYRAATGAGLKEAKEFIEEVMATSIAKDTIQITPRSGTATGK
jgi:ribosomal protein L7/L12